MCCQQLYRPQVRPSPPQITSLLFARNHLESSKFPPSAQWYHALGDHGCWGVLSEGRGKSYPTSDPATAGHRLSINKLVPLPFRSSLEGLYCSLDPISNVT